MKPLDWRAIFRFMQNEINLKEIKFEDYLVDNVKLFDEVLSEFGEPPLFENENFTVWNSPGVRSHCLTMEGTNKVTNTLPVMIWFEGENLRIDIDGIPETFEWAKKHIDEDRNSVLELIRSLFSGHVLIDERRSTKFIQIFDRNGDFVDCLSRNNLFHMLTGRFLFRFKDYRKLYLPLLKKK